MSSKAVKEQDSLNSILEVIGNKLVELRLKKGYPNLSDFTSAYNLPHIQYWRMEKGKANITLKSLHKVLSIHDLTIEDLFTELVKKQNKVY